MATPNSNADNKSRTKTAEALSESFGYAEVGSDPLVRELYLGKRA